MTGKLRPRNGQPLTSRRVQFTRLEPRQPDVLFPLLSFLGLHMSWLSKQTLPNEVAEEKRWETALGSPRMPSQFAESSLGKIDLASV